MQKKLTQEVVDLAKAEPGAQRSYFWDTAKPGFGLMVTASGHKSYVVQYRYRGHTKRITMAERNLSLDKARREAAVHLGEAAARRNPAANLGKQAKSGTLESIAREYFNREAKKPKAKKLRSLDDRIATFERLIFPGLGSHQITEIKKSDIIHLLERVEDERGPSMARVVFAYLSKLFNWHARRRDADFVSPIVRGMDEDLKDRINPPRDRVLDDNELRALWRAAEGFPGPFGYYVRLLPAHGCQAKGGGPHEPQRAVNHRRHPDLDHPCGSHEG